MDAAKFQMPFQVAPMAVAEATYEGDAIGELMPLVRVGEVMHVGKHAAFGNGRMEGSLAIGRVRSESGRIQA